MHYRWCHIRACIKVRKPGLAAEFKNIQGIKELKGRKMTAVKGNLSGQKQVISNFPRIGPIKYFT